MKYMLSSLFVILTLSSAAQKRFDSASYVNFYQDRWDKIDFNAYRSDRPVEELSADQKVAGLSKAWAEAKYNFANFDLVPNLNWDSLYLSYIPKVTQSKNTFEYYKVLQNFYRHLHDGHTAIRLPNAYMKEMNGLIDLSVRWIEQKAVVVTNASMDPGAQSVKAGMELVEWNAEPIKDYIERTISPYLHYSTPQDSTERIYRYELFRGKGGDIVELGFKTPGGKLIRQNFTFEVIENLWNRVPLLEYSVIKGNIGYLKLNSFGDEKIVKMFDSVFSMIEKTNGLIIDIRNNGGGNGQNGFEILGCLTDKPFFPGKTMIRQYRPVGRSWGGSEMDNISSDDWKPYKNKYYHKPVIVLTSGATYSAAEDFTSAYRSMNRGIVIGEATGGSTGQPIFFTLPGGGFGAVCSKRDFIYDGTEFVGTGIQPDVVIHPTIKGIIEGRDEVLEAAAAALKN